MNWKLLKQNKCPKCKSDIDLKFTDCMIRCKNCDFKISENRMKEIVNDIINKEF